MWTLYGLSQLGILVPNNRGVWVFGADGGRRFAGNSKYLFLHIANNRDDIRPVWLTNSPETLESLRDSGYETYLATSSWGLYWTISAEFLFVTHGRGDVTWWATGATEVVNLWHGCLLKRISRDRNGGQWTPLQEIQLQVRDGAFDHFVTTSHKLRRPIRSAFGLTDSEIHVLNYPRNDIFQYDIPDITIDDAASAVDMIERRAAAGPSVMYMPTYRRGYGMEHGEPSGPPIDEDTLTTLLDDYDATMFIKQHPHSEQNIESDSARIIELPADLDIYPYLTEFDILVTDYSSIYFDFLHLDRPIIFFPYDLEAYENQPGLYFDYDEVTPGPCPKSFEEFLDVLRQTLEGADAHEEDRAKIRTEFFEQDNEPAVEAITEHFSNPSA